MKIMKNSHYCTYLTTKTDVGITSLWTVMVVFVSCISGHNKNLNNVKISWEGLAGHSEMCVLCQQPIQKKMKCSVTL